VNAESCQLSFSANLCKNVGRLGSIFPSTYIWLGSHYSMQIAGWSWLTLDEPLCSYQSLVWNTRNFEDGKRTGIRPDARNRISSWAASLAKDCHC